MFSAGKNYGIYRKCGLYTPVPTLCGVDARDRSPVNVRTYSSADTTYGESLEPYWPLLA